MFINTLIQELRFGARNLARNPGFTAAAALTLALGIGANTTMFSVVSAMLLRPLPFPNRERLVRISATNEGRGWKRVPVSPLNFLDWREQNQSFEKIAAARFWFHSVSGASSPEQLHGMQVSPGFFSMLGVQPALGRSFLPEEEEPGRDRVVILTHGLWQRRYAGDNALIGKSITIDSEPFTVVGILPPSFWFFPVLGKDLELWMPFSFARSEFTRDARSIGAYGLLKQGVPIEQARVEMASIARRLEQAYPTENKGWGVQVDAGIVSMEEIRPKILLLFAAVGLVLLIACANVANLILARALRRRQETAVRSALGASRWALVRPLLAEIVLLGGVACVAGLVSGAVCLRFLVGFLNPRLESFFYGGFETIELDGKVFAFSLAASLISSALIGLVPAWQATRHSLSEMLKSGGRRVSVGAQGRRTRDVLVVCQVGLAVTLLVGAALMIRSLFTLQQVDRGLNIQNVLTMQIWPPENKYEGPREIAVFHRRVLEKLATLTETTAVSAISFLHLSEMGVGWSFTIDGRAPPSPEERPNAFYYAVEPGYCRKMEIPLLQGRHLSKADSEHSRPVAVIDENLARRYWPEQDPVGQRFKFDRLDSESPWHANLVTDWITVVGVVGAVSGDGLWEDGAPVIYLPYRQNPSRMMHLIVRAERDRLRLARAVQAKVWEVDPEQPVSFVRAMEEVPKWAMAERRLTMQLLTLFAALATLLSAVGLYGVISYAVSQRTQELGIRLALGAQRGDVEKMVLGEGMKLVFVGVGCGVAGAFLLTRFLASQLYGVAATDVPTFSAASLLIATVALFACYLPARRAARVDPITALRYE